MPSTYTSGNHLLDALSGGERAGWFKDVEIVTLPSRRWLEPYGGPRHHVDFPIDAVISIVATLRTGDAIEVGTVGREAFLETDAALESDSARRGSFCQIAGDVGRMSLDHFRERMHEGQAFARLMRRSVTATLFSAQQLAACNAKHRVEEQCARWLLATHDRVGDDAFTLTHEALAVLLGVRRASITVAIQSLAASGGIEQARGIVRVTDRVALRAAACECYEDCKDAAQQALIDPSRFLISA